MSKKKTVYKVRYVIEMEISEEYYSDNAGNQFVGAFPKITAYPPEIIVRDLESVFCRNAAKGCSYIEKHFPDEAKYVCAQMHDLEQLRLSGYPQPVKRKARKQVIEDIKKLTDTRARKRLTTPRGRTPKKDKEVNSVEREKFISKCVESLKDLQRKNQKKELKIGDLASLVCPTYIKKGTEHWYDNPIRKLRNDLKFYGITFDELKEKLTNNLT
jgi:hypothetical protein